MNLKNKKIDLLDKGFVRLVDFMGNDSSIVQAARVSYGQGTKTIREDRGLIRYLMRHWHTTPMEMCELKFHIKAPIFVARQWMRHRTASINELSARYSEMPFQCYLPESNAVTRQDPENKQGGTLEQLENFPNARKIFEEGQTHAHSGYGELLASGMRRELARINLPVSQYTEFYWKINLHNLLHFLRLRIDSHAQYEIRVFAQAIADFVKELYPITWEAFCDYRLAARSFSKQEMEILFDAIDYEKLESLSSSLPKRERKELTEKFLGGL